MPASISFDDGNGLVTLTPPSSVSRFNNWRQLPAYKGEHAWALDGRGFQFVHGTRYMASFTLGFLSNSALADIDRFMLWANASGEFTIATGDSFSNEYGSCQIAPETEASCSEPDRETLDYTLSMTVISLASPPVPLLCIYDYVVPATSVILLGTSRGSAGRSYGVATAS
jgi:hypothetical protein